MLKSIYDFEKIFLQSTNRTNLFLHGNLSYVICHNMSFAANSSPLSCVGGADFVQEPEDTAVPSTRSTLGQSDGVQKEACRGGSGCHISEVA